MKKTRMMFLLIMAVMLFFVLSSGAWADTVFNDVTKVQEWTHNHVYGSGLWKDVIGDLKVFDTSKAVLSGNTLTFSSNWNPSNDGYLGVKTADLFIDVGSNGLFDYAIRLDSNGIGTVYGNGLSYNTSIDMLSGTGYIYGGKYNETSPSSVPVWATSASIGSTTVTWGNGAVAVDLSGLNLVGKDWSFVWATATCANDTISGRNVTPIPAAAWLLGSGLLGLVGIRRRIKS